MPETLVETPIVQKLAPILEKHEAEEKNKPIVAIESDDEEFWGGQIEIEGLEPLPEGESYKNLPPLKDYINHLPVQVRQQLKNLQSNFTKKSQELANLRKELEEQIRIQQEERSFIESRLKDLSAPVESTLSWENIWEHPEKLPELIKQESFKSHQEIYKTWQQEMAKEREQVEYQKTLEASQKFIESKPEFKNSEFKNKVAELISQPGSTLSLEDAYLLVKAKAAEQETVSKFVERSNKDLNRKNIILKSSTKPITKVSELPKLDLKGLSAHEKMSLLEEYKKTYGVLPPK